MNSARADLLPDRDSHPFSLASKTILIVGVTALTGQHLTQLLSQMGARVIAQEVFACVNEPLDGLLYCAAASGDNNVPLACIEEAEILQVLSKRLAAPALAIRQSMDKGLMRTGSSIVLEKIGFGQVRTEQGGAFLNVEGGLGTLVGSMALEYAPLGVRVNAITTKPHPHQAADMEDFAHAAVYLLSPGSRWVTGSDLVITGQATR